MAPVANVVVGVPVDRVFSYVVPEGLLGCVKPGQRVRVPFRGKVRFGVVVGFGDDTHLARHAIEDVVDPAPALTGPLLQLARWAATETVSTWGETVARALPPAGRGTRRRREGFWAGGPASILPSVPLRPLVIGYGGGRARLLRRTVTEMAATHRGVLVLVPEIDAARAWAEELRTLGVGPVTVVTSDDPPGRRWEAWWACRGGGTQVVVGTRVAAFLPLASVGLIAVVDEHDPAHKAPDTPRWHARELALERARLEGARCVMMSATPSLETWVRMRRGHARGEETTAEAAWPTVHRVDLRSIADDTALSPPLTEALRVTLEAGRSAVLVVNRLGYARSLVCLECGALRRCGRCRVGMTYHLGSRTLACRLCGGRQKAASLCGRCRGRRLRPLGWGTERLEADVRQALPGVRVGRYDSEVDPRSRAQVREAFGSGEVRIVVGTQMALRLLPGARGVGLAALCLADATLSLPDFRAAERTFQLAWHLAEGVPGGELWLQSFYPAHPALEAVAHGARELFYEAEWTERQDLGYPPARRMARVVVEGRGGDTVVRDLTARCGAAGVTPLGPVELPGGRRQVVLLGDEDLPAVLGDLLRGLPGARWPARDPRVLVDVDPVELW